MDRQTALDRLELIRPDADEFHDPDFAEALAYLETDEPARQAFARRREQDRQIAKAVQDVPVPEGLKERLLEALADPEAADANGVAENPPHPQANRRRWLVSALVVMASGLLAALGVWWFHDPDPKLLSLQELELDAPYTEKELADLAAFRGEFEPALPGGLWSSERRFTFSATPKGFAPDREGRDRVAVYEFFFRDPRVRHSENLRGVLLVVPAADLEAAPESTSFFGAAYKTVRSKPHVAIRTWTENDLVYISMTPIQHDETLGDVLDPHDVG